MNIIATSLKESRENAKYTVLQVEQETGINHANIYRWENGNNKPTIDQCIKLADCYQCTLDELVGRDYAKIIKQNITNITINNK